RDSGAHATALRRLARPDSAPLPVSLSLDLEARASLATSDTAGALERWDRATRRYAVLSAPFDLVASLWPLRLDHARVAAARGDTPPPVRPRLPVRAPQLPLRDLGHDAGIGGAVRSIGQLDVPVAVVLGGLETADPAAYSIDEQLARGARLARIPGPERRHI